MSRQTTPTPARVGALLLMGTAALLLSACGSAERIAQIGKAPPLTPIVNPEAQAGYVPVSLPMPAPLPQERQANSLWRSGARAFFKDQRAGRVGDILTVLIEIDDSAQIENETERTRDSQEGLDLPGFFGLQTNLARVLPTPDGDTLEDLVDVGGQSTHTGEGTIDRSEQIDLRVAALITQVLPNGNLVLMGKQEIRVNFEVRELYITGIIRPEDITSGNTINYDQIAEARIAYGGRGQLTDVQQPRWGQQLVDVILPF